MHKKTLIWLLILIVILATVCSLYALFRQKSLVKAPAFSVVVLPDTQKYAESFPEIFCKQTDWIVQNKKNFTIAFVSHVGDIVENGAKKFGEWRTASVCMNKLDGTIPYSIVPGNHDSDIASQKASGFTTYNIMFPVARYSNYEWYKGHFAQNQNSYQIISVHGIDILFLSLEIEPTDAALAWAESVVKKYPNTYTIVTTHKYLPDNTVKRDATRKFSTNGNTGEDIWNKLISKNCSIKMVWSGHYHESDGENRIISENACGQAVHQITQDYQEQESGGNGKLRIYTFDPQAKTISVQTYSPYTDTYEKDEDSAFILPFEI